MAKDPAFLFYPGDYLKDTQCLSESAQTAYDRIMCEHMRNICISQERLNFFTKRLNDEQRSEVMHVLQKVAGGFQIEWVADSILKRRNYSDSRRKNREGKGKSNTKDMLTYVPHMENANGIDIANITEEGKGVQGENRIIILPKYASEKPIVIYNLRDHFTITGQLEAIERAGWIKFDEFMKDNPAATFNDPKHLYNAFKRFNTQEQKPNGTPKRNTNSAEVLDENIKYSDKF